MSEPSSAEASDAPFTAKNAVFVDLIDKNQARSAIKEKLVQFHQRHYDSSGGARMERSHSISALPEMRPDGTDMSALDAAAAATNSFNSRSGAVRSARTARQFSDPPTQRVFESDRLTPTRAA